MCPDTFPGYPYTCKQIMFNGVSVTFTAFYLFPGFLLFQVKQLGALSARILEPSCEQCQHILSIALQIANGIRSFSVLLCCCFAVLPQKVLPLIPSVSVPPQVACLLSFQFSTFKDFCYNLSVIHS